ncbi:unnamed protein product [Linum trigynum]|uniref:Integrase zinc-binding domain-containing protein n=1 Tax=Linum trigynum TaxID=586398 RepID=A0AAV2E4C4_9ROSI
MGYDYELHYRPGPMNKAANALSRVKSEPQVAAVTKPVVQFWDEVKKAVETSLHMLERRDIAFSVTPDSYTFLHRLVFHQGRVVLPSATSLTTTVMKEFHDALVGGHSGYERTLRKIRSQLYWPQMTREVKACCSRCPCPKGSRRTSA